MQRCNPVTCLLIRYRVDITTGSSNKGKNNNKKAKFHVMINGLDMHVVDLGVRVVVLMTDVVRSLPRVSCGARHAGGCAQ